MKDGVLSPERVAHERECAEAEYLDGVVPLCDSHEKLRDDLDAAEQRLASAITALQRIAEFGHISSCSMTFVPVHECGCYAESQWEIAERALQELDAGRRRVTQEKRSDS